MKLLNIKDNEMELVFGGLEGMTEYLSMVDYWGFLMKADNFFIIG